MANPPELPRRASDFPPEVLRLFDQYVHGQIDRRQFLDRAARWAVGGLTAAALLQALSPRFAEAQQVAPDDPRLAAEVLERPSPRGHGTLRGVLVRPAGAAVRRPSVLVIHENRGLNPHIEDVARRFALAGFNAFAPDALFPLGGYPDDEDRARELFARLDPAKAFEDFVAAVRVLIHFAEVDERINAGWPAYEAALREAGVRYEAYVYPGTQHGFHNDTTPRYDAAAAGLAWRRTLDFLKGALAA